MTRYKEEVIRPGDMASRLAHEICVASYGNCPAVEIIPRQPENFRGGVDFNWNKEVLRLMLQGKLKQTVQNDGAGGKPMFFTLLGEAKSFFDLGWEIITMCVDDVARQGGFSAIMLNDLNVKKITEKNYHLVKALLQGYGQALKRSSLVNITGEIAVMKYSITAFCDYGGEEQLVLTWGGASIGLSSDDKVIDGSKIGPDMPIVGLLDHGYRCNGGTLFADLLLRLARTDAFGNGRQFQNDLTGFVSKHLGFIRSITVPSISYAKTISRIHGWNANGTYGDPLVKIAGIAHITGGGIWGKFGEILPEGIGANLTNMPAPPSILLQAQSLSQKSADPLDDWHAYETFHGGCGMLVILETDKEADKFIEEAARDERTAVKVGKTVKSADNTIIIKSKFAEGRTLGSYEFE